MSVMIEWSLDDPFLHIILNMTDLRPWIPGMCSESRLVPPLPPPLFLDISKDHGYF